MEGGGGGMEGGGGGMEGGGREKRRKKKKGKGRGGGGGGGGGGLLHTAIISPANRHYKQGLILFIYLFKFFSFCLSFSFLLRTVYVKKNATLIKNDCAAFLYETSCIFMVFLWICAVSVLQRFLPTCHDYCQRATIRRNAPRFHGKSELGLRRFTRRRTLRDSMRVRRTQRDKHGTRYAVLISAVAASLLHSF